MNIQSELKARFRNAIESIMSAADVPFDEKLLDMIRPTQDAKFGDYQANCAMPLGKKLGCNPREVAQKIVDAIDVLDLCETVEIAGPGFINLKLKDDWIIKQLTAAANDSQLGVTPTDSPRKYVIDYSAPNVAKPMHVGHIRSTVIGDSLSRVLRFLGHDVITDNHIGDWGTQFGMIIYGWRHFRDEKAYEETPVLELSRLYRLVRQLADFHQGRNRIPKWEEELLTEADAVEAVRADVDTSKKKARQEFARREKRLADNQKELAALRLKTAALEEDAVFIELAEKHQDIATAVLEETAKLHAGDEANIALWQQFLPECRAEIQQIYDRLDIAFDEELGESFYHDRLPAVVDAFIEKGLARESDGAICVFMDQFDAPMIIRKRDGAFLYATTDLATIAYRVERWKPDAILYVVDFRQGDHFDKLFAATHTFWSDYDVELKHVSFGTVMGDDGKPFKTRSGDTVGLEGLLDEAVSRARAVVSANDDKNPNGPALSEEARDEVARIVGYGAVKYADLSHNRTTDYVFDYDKMLALNGDTGAYMQYAYARICNIFVRGGIDREAIWSTGGTLTFTHDAERALGMEILRLSEALGRMVEDYRPNILTDYLYSLADTYSTFYEKCPVLKADDEASKASRLMLCDLTAKTLRCGLSLLGVDIVEKM